MRRQVAWLAEATFAAAGAMTICSGVMADTSARVTHHDITVTADVGSVQEGAGRLDVWRRPRANLVQGAITFLGVTDGLRVVVDALARGRTGPDDTILRRTRLEGTYSYVKTTSRGAVVVRRRVHGTVEGDLERGLRWSIVGQAPSHRSDAKPTWAGDLVTTPLATEYAPGPSDVLVLSAAGGRIVGAPMTVADTGAHRVVTNSDGSATVGQIVETNSAGSVRGRVDSDVGGAIARVRLSAHRAPVDGWLPGLLGAFDATWTADGLKHAAVGLARLGPSAAKQVVSSGVVVVRDDGLVAVDDLGDGTIKLVGASDARPVLRSGDVIASEAGGGLLRRVVDVVSDDPTESRLTTEQATMAEAFPDGRVAVAATFDPTPSGATKSGKLGAAVQYRIENEIVSSDQGLTLTIDDAEVSLEASLGIDLDFRAGSLQSAMLEVTGTRTVRVAATAELAGDYSKSWEKRFPNVYRAPFLTWVWGVPVMGEVQLALVMRGEFDAHGSTTVSSGFECSDAIHVEVGYDRANGWHFDPSRSADFVALPLTWSSQAGATFRVTIIPEFTLVLYGTVGSTISPGLFGEVGGSIRSDNNGAYVDWTLDAGISLDGSVFARLFGEEFDQPFDLGDLVTWRIGAGSLIVGPGSGGSSGFADDFSANPLTSGKWTDLYRDAHVGADALVWDQQNQRMMLAKGAPTFTSDAGATGWMTADYVLPDSGWTAELDYKVGGGTAPAGYSPSDGLFIQFNSSVGTSNGSPTALGYFVFLDNFRNTWDPASNFVGLYYAETTSSPTNLPQRLDWVPDGRTRDNQWHHIKLDVAAGRISVYIDDMQHPILDHTEANFHYSRKGFGVCALTRTDDCLIDNVTISPR